MKKWSIGLAAGMTAMALAAPAMALDVTPYGAIRLGTWYLQNEFYNAANAKRTDSDFSMELQGDSLVGIRAKEGDFSAVAELGAYNPKNWRGGVELRLLFGEWDFGGGKLRVGKAPSPYVYRTQQVWDSDGGMNAYGSLWDGRYAQIKVTMNNGFYINFMQPRLGGSTAGVANNTTNVTNTDALAEFAQTGNVFPAGASTNYNNRMPKIVLGYEGKLDKWTYGGGVAYNMYNIEYRSAATANPVNTDIHSYLVFFHGKVDVAPVELSYHIFTGRNTGDLMSSANTAYSTGGGVAGGNNPGNTAGYHDIVRGVDAYTYGGWGQVGYTINKKWKVYAGASYVVDDNKIQWADERLCTFVNAQYQASKNFKIVPEVGYINDMRNSSNAKEPKQIMVGAKWEMVF